MTDDDNIKLQKKLYFMVDKLKEFHSKLDPSVQNRIPLENLITMGKNYHLLSINILLINVINLQQMFL